MKNLLTITLLLLPSFSFFSQDILVKKNGEEVECKVTEVSSEIIKYKKFTNLSGPVYTLPRNEVFMIKYENGEKDVFNDEKQESNGSNSTTDNSDGKVVTVTYSKLNTGNKSVSDRDVFHALKIDPIAFIVGEIPVFYERRLGDKISIEGGVGITMLNIWNAVFMQDMTLDEYYDDREVKIGATVMAEFRYYPSNYTRALEDIYFGPHIKYKRYNTTLINCGGTPLPNAMDESVSNLDTELKVGYIIYSSDRVFFDWYGGLGLRFTTNKTYDCYYNGNVYVTSQTFNTITKPTVSLGVKIGFAF